MFAPVHTPSKSNLTKHQLSHWGNGFRHTAVICLLAAACKPSIQEVDIDNIEFDVSFEAPTHLVDALSSQNLISPPPPPPPRETLLEQTAQQDWTDWQTDELTAPFTGCIESVPTSTSPSAHRTLPIHNHRQIEITGALQTTDVRPYGDSAGAGIRVTWLNDDGDDVGVADDLPQIVGTADPSHPFKSALTVPEDASQMRISFAATVGRGTGQACLEGISVVGTSMLETFLDLPRPVQSSHALARTVTLGRVTQPALLAPGAATWAFSLAAGQGTRLRMSMGVLSGAPPDEEVCFSVHGSGRDEPIWQKCSTAEHWSMWRETDIRLQQREAAENIAIQVRSENGLAIGALGDPRLVSAASTSKMNVVLVVIDTLRADHINAEGYTERSTTPNLDVFAQSAVRFAQTQSTSGWTAPSLGSVVTGLYPARHRAGRRRIRTWESESSQQSAAANKQANYMQLAPSVPVAAQHFRAHGFETAGFSSNNFFGPRMGFDRGFGRYEMIQANNLRGAKRVVERVEEWLDRRQRRNSKDPFFLTIHFIDPHHPYRMRHPEPEGYPSVESLALPQEQYNGVQATVLKEHTALTRADPLGSMVLYDAEIQYTDVQLSALLETLDDGNTAIVLLSDHGEGFGEHNHFIHGNSLFQELLHVPLWVKTPHAEPHVVESPVSLADVYPTLLQLGGMDVPEDIDGQPLPLDGAPQGERLLISEGMYNGDIEIAARRGVWKYIRQLPPSHNRSTYRAFGTAKEMLFQLDEDPSESNNIAMAQDGILAELRGAVNEHLSTTMHGIHLQCDGPADVQFQTTATIAQTDVLMGTTGHFWINSERSEASVAFAAAGHVVLRTLDLAEQSTVQVNQQEWFGLLPAKESAVTVDQCRIWSVFGEDATGEMSPEEIEELRALGYME